MLIANWFIVVTSVYHYSKLQQLHTKQVVFYTCVLCFLVVFGVYLYKGYFPSDSSFRSQPRHGDRYFLNYYKISQDPEQSRFPYKMARLIRVDQKRQVLILNLGRWSYSSQYVLIRDYLSKQDLHFSYFSIMEIDLPLSALTDTQIIWQIRRRSFFIDIEQQQDELSKQVAKPRAT